MKKKKNLSYDEDEEMLEMEGLSWTVVEKALLRRLAARGRVRKVD